MALLKHNCLKIILRFNIFSLLIFPTFFEYNQCYSDGDVSLNKSTALTRKNRKNALNVDDNSINFHEVESNNDFSSANRLYENNFSLIDACKIVISGNLGLETNELDKDYFAFTLERDSSLDVNVSLMSSIKPNFSIYKICYSSDVNGVFSKIPNRVFSIDMDSTNFTQTLALNPGTYYICLDDNRENYISGQISYSISLNIEKESVVNNTINLYDLKYNKGLNAAVWINDILPGQISPFNLLTRKVKIYDSNSKNPDFKDFLIEDLINASDKIPTFSLYFLNEDLINEFFNLLNEMCIVISDKLEEDENVRFQLNTISAINEGISVTLDVFSSIIGSPTVSFTISTVSFLTTQLVGLLIDGILLNMPDYDHLRNFCSAVSAIKPFASDIEDILKFEFYFDVSEDDGDVYLDYSVTFPNNGDFSEFFIVNNTHISNNKGYWYTNGDFYALDSWQNSENTSGSFDVFGDACLDLSKFILVENIDYLDPEYLDLPINYAYTFSLDNSEYKRFKFKALTTGTYYFTAYGLEASNLEIGLTDQIFKGYYGEFLNTYRGGYVSAVDSSLVGVYFKYNLNANDEIYLRISGKSLVGAFQSLNFIISNTYPDHMLHTHTYREKYLYVDKSYHSSVCECGVSKLEGHILERTESNVPARKYRCIKCKAYAEVGFVIDSVANLFINGKMINDKKEIVTSLLNMLEA